MTKRQKGKLSGGRVRRKKNEETAREMPGECGSRKTKKGERAEIRGIKTESTGGDKNLQKKGRRD